MQRRERRRSRVDFAVVRVAALARLPELLARWLPGGELCGREYTARNPRRADRRPGSMRINVDTGRWADFARDDARGGDPVSLAAYLAGCSQVEAARRLAEMLGCGDGCSRGVRAAARGAR
jgi:hypothetical protein